MKELNAQEQGGVKLLLHERWVCDVLDRLHGMRDVLTANPAITHMGLLRAVRPDVGIPYERAFKCNRTPIARFLSLHSLHYTLVRRAVEAASAVSQPGWNPTSMAGSAYRKCRHGVGADIWGSLITPLTTFQSALEQECNKTRGELTQEEVRAQQEQNCASRVFARLDAILQQYQPQVSKTTASLQRSILQRKAPRIEDLPVVTVERLLQECPWREYSATNTMAIVAWASHCRMSCVEIANGLKITDRHLLALLKESGAGLRKLIIPGCTALTPDAIRRVYETAHKVQKLDASRTMVEKFTPVKGNLLRRWLTSLRLMDNVPFYRSLTTLALADCEHLATVDVSQCHHLRHFDLRNCTALLSLVLISDFDREAAAGSSDRDAGDETKAPEPWWKDRFRHLDLRGTTVLRCNSKLCEDVIAGTADLCDDGKPDGAESFVSTLTQPWCGDVPEGLGNSNPELPSKRLELLESGVQPWHWGGRKGAARLKALILLGVEFVVKVRRLLLPCALMIL